MLQAQQLVMVSPPPCSLLACTNHPISLMVQQTPAAAPLKFLVLETPAVALTPLKPSHGPSLPVGSARRSFLPPAPIKRRKSLDSQSSIAPQISQHPLLHNSTPTHISLSSCQYELEGSSQNHSNSFSNPGGPSCYNTLQPSSLGQFDWPTTLNFSATQPQKRQEKEPKKGANLERVSKLTFVARG